jgi:hypothetical protein
MNKSKEKLDKIANINSVLSTIITNLLLHFLKDVSTSKKVLTLRCCNLLLKVKI